MRNPDGSIIDASVAAKWYLRDEDLLPQADEVLGSVPTAHVAAPHIIRYEIANSLASAFRSGRISRADGEADLAHFLQSSLGTEPDPDSVIQAAQSIVIDSSIYILDAVYIALAAALGCEFITDDRRLYDAVSDRFPFVRWLGDVPVT
jgi:predicted nucleic acid-binding protein